MLHRHQGVAGVDPRAAVGHDVGGVRDAEGGEAPPQLLGAAERLVGVQVVAEERAERAGDVPGAGVHRFGLAAVALGGAGVQDERGGAGVVDGGQVGRQPRARRERAARRGVLGPLGQPARPGAEAAVQQGGVHPQGPEQPHQPTRDGAAGVVIGDDQRVVRDARRPHAFGEHLRGRQRVPAALDGRRRRQVGVQVDEHRPRQVAGQVLDAAVAAVQVPADVAEDGLGVVGQPGGVDDDGDPGSSHPPTVARRRRIGRSPGVRRSVQ